MKRYVLIGLLGIGSMAQAQTVTEPVVSWDVEFWSLGVTPGSGSSINGIQSFAKTGATCDLPPTPAPVLPVVNPTEISLEDPNLPGRDCILGFTQSSGVLAALPLGVGITATARARGATLISPRSAASNPFSRVTVVAAPTTPSRVLVHP